MSEPKKIRRLSKLNASEVSLVNRGAIRRPFLVIKNQEGTEMVETPKTVVPQLNGDQEQRFLRAMARFTPVAKADGEVAEVGEDTGLDERAMAALKAVYRILLPFKGQIPEDAVDDVLAELDLDDTGDDEQDEPTEEVNNDDQGTDPEPEEETAMAKDFDPEDLKKAADWSPSKPDGSSDADHMKAVQAAKDAYAKCIGKGADDEDEDEEDDEDVKKSAVAKAALPKMSNAELERVAKAEAGRAAAERDVAELRERITKMEDERELSTLESSLAADCATLGKNAAEQARIVKSAYAANKEAGDAYVALLRESAKNATQGSGIFKSVGTSTNAAFGSRGIPSAQGTPQQRFDAMVRGVVEKGEAADEVAATMKVLSTVPGQEAYNQIHGGRN